MKEKQFNVKLFLTEFFYKFLRIEYLYGNKTLLIYGNTK